MASSALPETLKSVTSTKIQELKKQRDQYESSKRQILRDAKLCSGELERTRVLLEGACQQAGVRLLDDYLSEDEEIQTLLTNKQEKLDNQQRLLRQAAVDPAFSPELVQDIQAELLEDFELKSVQHEHAQFFSELVTEWLSADQNAATKTDGSTDDAAFEPVGRKEMHEQRAQWESIVYGQAIVDEQNIRDYLTKLFTSTKAISSAYDSLLKATKNFSNTLWESTELFSPTSLKTTITGVLQTDLLSEEKSSILKSFQNNKEVLQEVADVLNMRYACLETWEWTTNNGAIPVQQRRQLNGKYRVFMDEDVLDALLLHAVGMQWAVHFKSRFSEFFNSYAWKKVSKEIPKLDKERREYFLGADINSGSANTVEARRLKLYKDDYFMTQLPIDVAEGTRGYGDEDSDAGSSPRKSPVEIKQSLLHLLITENLVAKHLRPGTAHAVIRSDFQWFGPSLSHEAIFTVLGFFGTSARWLTFFRKFLTAPMRFVQDGPQGQVNVRSRGVPMSHALSDVFGEAILFVMDFAVNNATQTNLYRLHDDFWFWGSEDTCSRGWEVMTNFASVMGLTFNEEKTGTVVFDQASTSPRVQTPEENSDLDMADEARMENKFRLPRGDVRWGFLRLDAKTACFVIDQTMVDEHIEELKRQLSHCSSIFSYIQAYNAYLARFFSNNFGKPSYAFGTEHIDMMIETFSRIQRALFPDGSVTGYLSKVAEERFRVKDIPDGVWYWPVALGGMELRNPLVSLFCMRDSINRPATKILAKSLDRDEIEYVAAEDRFKRQNSGQGIGRWRNQGQRDFGDDFMSREEFLRHREARSDNLGASYAKLLEVPEQRAIRETQEITAWTDKLSHTRSGSGIHSSFTGMAPYWQWILAAYGAQVAEKYGSVVIVDASQVPLGVVSVMKAGKIRWQG